MKSEICEALPSYLRFPHHDSKYTCCCGVHATAGAKVLGVLGAICIIIDLYGICFSTEWTLFHYMNMILDGPVAVCLVLLFLGLNKKKAMYLVPYLTYSVVSVLITAVFLVLSAIAYHNPTSDVGKMIVNASKSVSLALTVEVLEDPRLKGHIDVRRTLISIFASSSLIAMIVTSWFLSIVCKCYRYLKDLEAYNRRCCATSKA